MDVQRRTNESKCLTCNKTFSQKSSLIRHSKSCANPPRPSSLRQKSCQSCSVAKAKCDLKRPHCSRCTSRKALCGYPAIDTSQEPSEIDSGSTPSSLATPAHTVPEDSISSGRRELQDTKYSSQEPSNMFWNTRHLSISQHQTPSGVVESDRTVDLTGPSADSSVGIAESNSELEDVEWMLSLLPPAEPSIIDTTPVLAKHSMTFLLRVFRTWPHMISKGFQLPPLFHNTLTEKTSLPLPLTNCFTLAKMWSYQYDGSSTLVQETILKETKSLIHNLPTYDETHLLAALQALTIYNIMLLFPSQSQNSLPEIDPSIFHGLQQAVFRTASTGLILEEEASSIIPSWDTWIHVTSKRRAVFVLYVLHWAYAVYHHLPSFNCEEIGFMPAPTPKFLWNAGSKLQWEGLYNRWLIQWDGVPFLQHEFMSVEPGLGMDKRVQLWLEDADELGVLFMSIVNTTEREAEFAMNMYTARSGGLTSS